MIIDVARFVDSYATDMFGPGSSAPPTFERWTIDPTARKVSTALLDDSPREFPRINGRYAGRQHRYGYTAEAIVSPTSLNLGNLTKHDLDRGTAERHDVEKGCAASEPVFAATPDDTGEDAGWVLSVVYHPARDASDVIIIDATNFAAPPVATIHLPRRVPHGFHGAWIPRVSIPA